MRRSGIIITIIMLLSLVVFTACQSSYSVSRVSSDKDLDLSGNWNDTDIRLVSEALVQSSLKGGWINQFRMKNVGRNPVVIVGTFINRSSEHIDTAIIAKRYEMELINSGKVDMVADQNFRASVRQEREEQQYFASEESAKALGKEIGADFLLQGAVRSVLDQKGNTRVRTYYVSAELIDIETNRKVWLGEETIKKVIQQARYSL
ncbi:MAG: penicillin-binding protein activator LpoB [Spirochaetales bacterium]|nr:penicillin-binding protein activator LpoB [Spirochaetales bacterium]